MKLFNVNDPNKPNDCIYIGRGTIYGNPFKIGIDGTRNEVIQKYIEYVENTPDLKFKILKNLKGKNIMCHCTPKKCHGDYIISLLSQDVIDGVQLE